MENKSGWVLFSTTIFIVIGVLNVIFGLTMLINNEWIVFGAEKVWYVDITTWGWITLLVGVLQLFVAWGVASAQTWARIVGVIFAAIALINAFFVVPYYPIWAIIVAVLTAMVIYALTVHGDEVDVAA
ncbi:MAG: DUF7144 family membrane protein [Acidimicrobiia bacterium]